MVVLTALCHFGLFLTISIGSASTSKVPEINPFINQTSTGSYTLYGFPNGEKKTYTTLWYQDDLDKKLMLSVGVRGQKPWMQAFWFLEHTSYQVISTDKEDPYKEVCIEIPDFNYSMEIGAYSPKYLSYMGDLVIQEKGRQIKLRSFAGQALDAAGPLNVVASVDEDGLYAKMAIIGSIGSYHFGEYYLVHRNNKRPPANHFKVPSSCEHAQKIYFFRKYNIKGKKLVSPQKCRSGRLSVSVMAMALSVYLCIVIGLYRRAPLELCF